MKIILRKIVLTAVAVFLAGCSATHTSHSAPFPPTRPTTPQLPITPYPRQHMA
jgi:PBP1b-binding outer membrane lipoprotein LpoB